MFEQWLHQIVCGVVGAGGGPGLSLHKGEAHPLCLGDKAGVVFQQPFVDRAELLGRQRAKVDRHALAGLGIIEIAQAVEGFEQSRVAQPAGGQGAQAVWAEELPAQGGRAGQGGFVRRFEELEAGQ